MKYLKQFENFEFEFNDDDFDDEEIELSRYSIVSSKGIHTIFDTDEYVILMDNNWIEKDDILLIHKNRIIRPIYITNNSGDVATIVRRSTLMNGFDLKKTLIILDENDWNRINEGDKLYVKSKVNINENFEFDEDDFDDEEIELDFMGDIDVDLNKFIMYKWQGKFRLCYLIKKNYSGNIDYLSVWDVDKRNPKLNCYDEFRNNYEPASSLDIEKFVNDDKLKNLLSLNN